MAQDSEAAKSIAARARARANAVRRKLTHQLHESNERYKLVAKATNDVIYDLDIKRAHLTWNDALHTKYGYPPDEPTDTLEWWTGHIHPDDALLVEREIGMLLDNNAEAFTCEYRFQKADGSYAFVRDRAYVLRGRDGKPRRLIGSLLDITQQKELDRAKDEFLSLSSHQLRTPLTITHVLSDMLASGMVGELAPEQRDYAMQISRTCLRMVRLVGDMLSISRMELNRLHLQPVPTDVNELIASHIGEVASAAAEKGVTIRFAHKPLPHIPIDHMVFGHIIENLLTNAVRYTPPDEGKVQVSFSQVSNGYDLVVQDNGIGIPAAAQEHVFERFFRADNAVTAETSGTGLGLYLVKILTDAFGGSVHLHSTEGTGTTATVHIPPEGMVPRQTTT